jgi:tetratricopeptide (TPR) repeat protein
VRARLERITGAVKLQRSGSAWERLTTGWRYDLVAGDQLLTGQRSGADILIDGGRVHVFERTQAWIPAAAPAGQKAAPGVWLIVGKALVWLVGTRGFDLGSEGAIAGANGTKFLVEVDESKVTTLTVLEGQVTFHNDLGSVVVHEAEQSRASKTMAPTRPSRVDLSGYVEWEASLDNLGLGLEMRYNPAESPDRFKQLTDEARAAAAAAPADPAAQIRLGDLLGDTGDPAGSISAYRTALQLAPQSVDTQVRLGYALLQAGQIADATAAFTAAAAANPTAPEPLVGQAAALLCAAPEGSPAQADTLLAQALALKPDYPRAHLLLGFSAMRQGDAARARASLERALAVEPTNYQALAYLSTVQLATGEAAAGLQSARQAVAAAPSSALAHQSLATAEFFAGDLTIAKAEADAAVKANPGSAAAHLVASDVAVAEGDLRTGLAEAQLAVMLDPGLAPGYSALGMIFLALNDLPQAEKAFANATRLSPKLVAARTGLGVTYARQGKLAEAMEAQKASIALDSGSASVHNNLGAIHLSLGDLDEAVREFLAAAQQQPGWGMPHANLAMAYLDLNQFADAVREGELAVKLGDDSARLHTSLARVYLEQNRVNKAWAELRRALELDDHYALAHLEIAEVYNDLGLSRDAINHQLRALSLQPSSIAEDREYARTDAEAALGSFAGDLKMDGRGDDGQGAIFAHLQRLDDDNNRPHSHDQQTTGLLMAGTQPDADRTDSLFLSAQRDTRDRPGPALAPGNAPSNPDFTSVFVGREADYLSRRSSGDTSWTFKFGYQDQTLAESDPDSLAPDPYPLRQLTTQAGGPLAEMRYDGRPSQRSTLTAGVAFSGQTRELSGELGMANPPGPPTFTPFDEKLDRSVATFYLEEESAISPSTKLRLGGRVAAAEGATPVIRPKASLRHDLGQGRTLILLTRPIMADDVSELAPVDDYALRDWISPLDLADGGYSQSWELQYQLMPRNASLLRLSGFYRTLRNFIVDLEDPAWDVGQVPAVLAGGTMRGGEFEWEQWIGKKVTAGLWTRLSTSENEDNPGHQIPYQPKLSGILRLDYLDESGLRIDTQWLEVGRRYADIANTTLLGSYGTLNLRVDKQFNLHTDLFFTLENVLNRDYAFYQDYPGRSRKLQAGVKYRF